MPNHITNRITIQAEGKQLEDILDTIKNDEIGRGSIDFNKLIPMPKSLDIMSGSETDRAISIYLTAINPEKPNMGCSKVRPYELIALEQGLNRHKHFASYKGDLSQDKIAEYTQYHPISHYLNLGKSAVDNFLQHGAITWYEWCINNWGTKWNAYGYDYMDYHPKENVLEYNTAWSNVPEILQVLSEKFPIHVLNGGSSEITEWDESMIRQIVDTVKVIGEDKILVCLRGGMEIEEILDKERE